jgi:hypothetical protein
MSNQATIREEEVKNRIGKATSSRADDMRRFGDNAPCWI